MARTKPSASKPKHAGGRRTAAEESGFLVKRSELEQLLPPLVFGDEESVHAFCAALSVALLRNLIDLPTHRELREDALGSLKATRSAADRNEMAQIRAWKAEIEAAKARGKARAAAERQRLKERGAEERAPDTARGDPPSVGPEAAPGADVGAAAGEPQAVAGSRG